MPESGNSWFILPIRAYWVEQNVAVLKQAALGMPVTNLIRQVGISEQTFYRWKKQYAVLGSNQVRELKLLQDENVRLKKLVAELSLDKAILQRELPSAARVQQIIHNPSAPIQHQTITYQV